MDGADVCRPARSCAVRAAAAGRRRQQECKGPNGAWTAAGFFGSQCVFEYAFVSGGTFSMYLVFMLCSECSGIIRLHSGKCICGVSLFRNLCIYCVLVRTCVRVYRYLLMFEQFVCRISVPACLHGDMSFLRGRRQKWPTLEQHGNTALMHAARHGHADFVRLLLDAGADKEAKNKVLVGRTSCGFATFFLKFLDSSTRV